MNIPVSIANYILIHYEYFIQGLLIEKFLKFNSFKKYLIYLINIFNN